MLREHADYDDDDDDNHHSLAECPATAVLFDDLASRCVVPSRSLSLLLFTLFNHDAHVGNRPFHILYVGRAVWRCMTGVSDLRTIRQLKEATWQLVSTNS